MWDDLAKELERIDILVNSAGITQTRSGLTDLDLSEWNRIIAVNQTGTLLGMRMAVSLMLGKGACSIVNRGPSCDGRNSAGGKIVVLP